MEDHPEKIQIVPNQRPVYLAVPVEDSNSIEISLEPIVAWKVFYDEGPRTFSQASPITISPIEPELFIIYDQETTIWSEFGGASGKGMNGLLDYLLSKSQ